MSENDCINAQIFVKGKNWPEHRKIIDNDHCELMCSTIFMLNTCISSKIFFRSHSQILFQTPDLTSRLIQLYFSKEHVVH